jgi:anti-sigma factor RsiW
MDCRDYRLLMPGLLEDDLSPREDEQLSSHLRDCAACRNELRLLSNSLDLFVAEAPAEVEVSPYLASRIAARAAEHVRPQRALLPRLAAGIAALLVAAALYAGFLFRPPAGDKTAIRVDSIKFTSPAMGVEIEKDRFVLHSKDRKGKAAIDLNL